MPLQDPLEKEVQSRHTILHGSGCQLLDAQHVQLELTDFLDAELVGRFVAVDGKITNRVDVPANGVGRKLRRWSSSSIRLRSSVTEPSFL